MQDALTALMKALLYSICQIIETRAWIVPNTLGTTRMKQDKQRSVNKERSDVNMKFKKIKDPTVAQGCIHLKQWMNYLTNPAPQL